MSKQNFRSGYIAITGRPNVGKSTLLNHILGQKLSITSRKPQTTRHQILGVKTTGSYQAIYVDTPGIHQGKKNAMNKYMNKTATSVIKDVDIVLFVIQAMKWLEEDKNILKMLKNVNIPVVLVINKIDQMVDKELLLPFIEKVSVELEFKDVIPVSAIYRENLDTIENLVKDILPISPPFFTDDKITDRSVRFLSAEIIREKIIRELGQELPYISTVNIESFDEEENITKINALIYVETKGQKAIVIGSKGKRLKSIGSKARKDIETVLDRKVYLELWVKVREGWSDDQQALLSMGYGEEK